MKRKSDKTNLIFRLMCFLLVVTSFTSIALAKYISSRQNDIKAEIGSFRCSLNVQLDENETMIPFFNTQYLINGSIMNLPQDIPFIVNNRDLKEDGSYTKEFCAVDLKYDLVFYVPREFATIAALQLAKINEERKEVAATPLYFLKDFINASAKQGDTVDVKGKYEEIIVEDDGTGDKKEFKINYGSLDYDKDETFTLDSAGDSTKVWKTIDKNTTIRIEQEKRNAKLRYVFPTYDRYYGKNPIITRCAPIYVTKNVEELGFYKITISRPEFVLKGGEQTDCNYSLRMINTRDLATGENTCLNTCKDHKKDESGNFVVGCQDAIYGTSFKKFIEDSCQNAFCETSTGGYYDMSKVKNPNIKWEEIDITKLESVETKVVEDEKEKTITLWKINDGVPKKPDGNNLEGYYVGEFIEKSYPVRINAVFTQTKIKENSQTESSSVNS